MILLEPIEISWINGQKDAPDDLCAHGKINFQIGNVKLVGVEDGEFTLSAAALYLLRTLEGNHSKDSPLCEHLFPCCGHEMYEEEGNKNVVIWGCPMGKDFEIIHSENQVQIQLQDSASIEVAYDAWKQAVIQFSQSVKDFYESSSLKKPVDEIAQKGFNRFLLEWDRRHSNAVRA